VPVVVVITRGTAGSGLARSGSARTDETIGLRWIHRPQSVSVQDAFIGPLPHGWHAPSRSMTASYEILDASAELFLLQWMQRASSRPASHRRSMVARARALVAPLTAFAVFASLAGAVILRTAMR
jgi:hypothetical protein